MDGNTEAPARDGIHFEAVWLLLAIFGSGRCHCALCGSIRGVMTPRSAPHGAIVFFVFFVFWWVINHPEC